jgi:DNA-binding YbaB/EbfC family protein
MVKYMKARLPQGYSSGGASNLQQLAKQAQKMQENMAQIEEELNNKEYTESSGGDMVKVTVTGKMEVTRIEIKKEAVSSDDIEMLEDLVAAAVNKALESAKNDKDQRMNSLTGGLNMPGLM